MTNGHDEDRVPSPGPDKIPINIRGLLLDATGVLVVPANGLSMPELVAREAGKVLGTTLAEDPYETDRRICELRIELSKTLPASEQAGYHYWRHINPLIYSQYGCTPDQGEQISRNISEDPDLYAMPEDLVRFFKWLILKKFKFESNTDNCQVVTASNGESVMIDRLLRRYNMRDLFHHLLSADELGTTKPDLEFFRKILVKLRLEPEHTLMIGDSPFKDLAAARLGIWTIWFRDKHESITDAQVRDLHGRDAFDRIFIAESWQEAMQIIDLKFEGAA